MASRPIQKISGPKLAAARRELFLSQKQLGDRAGLTESRIGQIEQAPVAGVPLNRVPLLAAALNLSSDDFVRRIGLLVEQAVPEHGASAQGSRTAARRADSARDPRQIVLSLNSAIAAELTSRAAAAGRTVSDYAADLVLNAVRATRPSGKAMKRAAKRMGKTRGKRR